MDLVDTLLDVRYWSEVLHCTNMTHISDLDLNTEILSLSFWLTLLTLILKYR